MLSILSTYLCSSFVSETMFTKVPQVSALKDLTLQTRLKGILADLFSGEDVIFWSQWLECFMETMYEFIPSKVIKLSINLPYLTKNVLHRVKLKHCLFKCAKQLHICTTKLTVQSAKTHYFQNLSLIQNQLTCPGISGLLITSYHQRTPG